MRMAVRAVRHVGVRVLVVAVVVPMRMLVVERVVDVLVRVALRKVQNDAGEHERAAGDEEHVARAIAEGEGQRGADERREREHRTGARRAERALGEQVEAQADAVAGGADREQPEHRRRARQRLHEQQCDERGGERAERRLGHHHLARIAVGERARQRVVEAPGGRRDDDGDEPRCRARAGAMAARDEQHGACDQERHRRSDAPVDRFAIQRACEQGSEDDLEREQERDVGRARALQSPGERSRSDDRATRRDRKQPARVAAQEPRLSVDAAGRQRADQRRAGVEQRRGRERAEADAEALDERRARAEQHGREQRQQRAAHGRPTPRDCHGRVARRRTHST